MTLIQALNILTRIEVGVLTTQQAAALLNVSCAHASKILGRLALGNNVVSLKRALWLVDTKLDGFQVARYITTPFPSYISLQSALYFHEMISQIPDTIYLMTLARSATIATPVAHYSLHHVNPDFFFGFDILDSGVALASPEKALIDFLYLTPSTAKYMKSLPELSFPKKFSVKKAKDIMVRIPSIRTRSLVLSKFNNLMHKKF